MCKILNIVTRKKFNNIEKKDINIIFLSEYNKNKSYYLYNVITQMCACDFFNKRNKNYEVFRQELKTQLTLINKDFLIMKVIYYDENDHTAFIRKKVVFDYLFDLEWTENVIFEISHKYEEFGQ